MGEAAQTSPVIPLALLGAVVAVLVLATVGVALAPRVPYHVFQKVHRVLGSAAFIILTVHSLLAGAQGPTSPSLLMLWTVFFAIVGFLAFGYRAMRKTRGGIGAAVTQVIPRERAVEVRLTPDGDQLVAAPGQFVLVTATVGGRRETHPFTLVNPAGVAEPAVLVRATGDWTRAAQQDIEVGGRVHLEGPFGAFLPGTSGAPETWIAGGVGITPFLAVIRTALLDPDQPHPPVTLVLSAKNAADAPCWDELAHAAQVLPWLSLDTAFTGDGQRLTPQDISALLDSSPFDAHRYTCGPVSLNSLVEEAYAQTGRDPQRFHRENYSWR
jgi:predicted ferric reductase